MYFCYVDESGDFGAYDASMPNKSGTPYFILAGLIVHAEKWKFSLDVLKNFRKKLAAQSYLPLPMNTSLPPLQNYIRLTIIF